MVTIFAWPHNARMLIQFEGDFSFEGQARAFQDDFWCELVSHREEYTPSPNGLQLGAVKYIVPQAAWDATGSTEPPILLGYHLHLNEALGVYVLHAWIWKNNPAGIFEDWNAKVSCT